MTQAPHFPEAGARCHGRLATSLIVLLGAMQGCNPTGPAPAAPPPLDVIVERVSTQPTPNLLELSGRIEASRSVQVRARADGILERELFEPGSMVQAGQVLYEIDRRDLRARQAQAQAALSAANAAQRNAATVFDRVAALLPRKAVSAQEYDTAQANLQQAQAAVLEARAALDRANLQLEHATVRAPIGGRIGRSLVNEGALLSAASATLLAQIDQLDPVFAVFNPSGALLADLRHHIETGQVRLEDASHVTVTILAEGGRTRDITGVLDFAAASVDPTTGSQVLRARVDNPGTLLLPGQFVRAVLVAGTQVDGVTIPERAVSIGADGASVMIVGEDGVVASRPVTLGAQTGGRWLIHDGLKPGERVVVEGWHKVQPGQTVSAREAGAGETR